MNLIDRIAGLFGYTSNRDVNVLLSEKDQELVELSKENGKLGADLKSCKSRYTNLIKTCAQANDIKDYSHMLLIPEGHIHDTLNALGALKSLSTVSDMQLEILKKQYDISSQDLKQLWDINQAIKMDTGSSLRLIKKHYGINDIPEEDNFDLEQILEASKLEFFMYLKEKPIEMYVKIEENSRPVVFGNPYDFADAVKNLVKNACKYTDDGSVTIGLSYNQKDNNHYVTVEDTGLGIEEDKFETIFTLGGKSKSSESTDDTNGAGLSQVREYARGMGGDAYVESEVGVGSKFTLRIPFEKPRNIYSNNGSKNYRILVAENESSIRLFASSLIEKMGYSCETAEDGRDVLNILEKDSSFDLVLMDYRMIHIDGDEATRIIRSEKKYQKYEGLPIIAMTAGLKGDLDICLEAGMDDHVDKPLNSNQLQEVFDKYLPAPDKVCFNMISSNPGVYTCSK